MKTMMRVMLAAVAGAALVGCAGMKYGDGKVAGVSIDPAVAYAAKLADGYVPGSGAKIRDYADGAKAERVPPGYAVRWRSFLDGKEIDRAKIVDKPELVPASASAPAVVVETAGQDATAPVPTKGSDEAFIKGN